MRIDEIIEKGQEEYNPENVFDDFLMILDETTALQNENKDLKDTIIKKDDEIQALKESNFDLLKKYHSAEIEKETEEEKKEPEEIITDDDVLELFK